MDRTTVAQLVGMLVVLAALFRWLPAADPELAVDDPFGRGDPIFMLSRDWQAFQRERGHDMIRARMLGMIRRPGYDQHWYHLIGLVRRIEARGEPDDVVQLRHCWRNEMWILSYYLYPRRIVGVPRDNGGGPDDPISDSADWLITGSDPGTAPTLERRP